MGGRDHACEYCGRGGMNDPDGKCECVPCPDCGGRGGEWRRSVHCGRVDCNFYICHGCHGYGTKGHEHEECC
jgi:hypothetical protein